MTKPAFMRESFKRTWAHRKMDEDCELSFTREVERYFGNGCHGASPGHRHLAGEIARQLTSYIGQPVISAIPCFALEQPDSDALCNHVNQIGGGGGHVVILVNAGSPQLEMAAESLSRRLTASLGQRCSRDHFSVAVTVFEHPRPIGFIRKMLTDAIMLRALQLKVEDPVVVSNDVDVCHTPSGYVAALKSGFSDPCADVLTGPLYYGYAPSGVSFLGNAPAVPDLLLGNKVLEARRLCQLRGYFHGARFFSTEGPHTAFRASAYCAAGGYDAGLEQAEDDEMGIAMFALRQKGCFPFPTRRNAIFAPDFWMVTNPRRQILAIANGHSIIETWRKFPIKQLPGHAIALESKDLRNPKPSSTVSLEGLASLVTGGPLFAKTWTSVVEIFNRGVGDQLLAADLFAHYLRACGADPLGEVGTGADAATLAGNVRPSPALKAAIVRFAAVHHRTSQQERCA